MATDGSTEHDASGALHAAAEQEHGGDTHGDEGLGPIDVRAWGAFVGGIALGLVVAVCIGISTGYLG
jgi:hypothetical protein